jgi:YD repeat-containing protein
MTCTAKCAPSRQPADAQRWSVTGRPEEQWLGSHDGKSVLLKRQYHYDPAGQLTGIHDSRRGQLAYQYDPLGACCRPTAAWAPKPSPSTRRVTCWMKPTTQPPAGRGRQAQQGDGQPAAHLCRQPLPLRRTRQPDPSVADGVQAHFTWDLFDRLVRYNDDKLKVDYSYDALGRRLHKHSVAHFWDRPEAGTGWNQLQRAKRQRELGCGFTLFGWDGDTLAWESSPPRDEGDTGRTVHYLYEPGSFVPVAQALRNGPIRLHKQPDWSLREYDFDQDPLWHTEVKPQAFDAMAWYHCDHLGTPQELTDEQGNVVWSAHYTAWGKCARNARSEPDCRG